MNQNNTVENLLEKVKKNLIISHSEDDDLIIEYIKIVITSNTLKKLIQ